MFNDNFIVINIRDYLLKDDDVIGEELYEILSDFSCPLNLDVEKFLKEQAIEFAKKNQSVTYLVFSQEEAILLGYFTLTIKPITVDANKFSNTAKRKFMRISELNEENQTFHMAAYLIAQLGKNYSDDANGRITGKQLLKIAVDYVKKLQYAIGGMVVFLETEDIEKLINFYSEENGFIRFKTRERNNSNQVCLIQMLKII